MFWEKPQPLNLTTPHQEQRCLGYIKRLTQALIVSGTVNILLLAFVLYGLFGNGMLVFRDSLKPRLAKPSEVVATTERTIGQVLQSYQLLTLEQLMARLEDATLFHNGYSERDLAIGYLVWRHHFNLAQALADCPATSQQHIPIRTGNYTTQLTLFPALTDRQYAAIVQFAKTERWPLTSEGLFHELKRQARSEDASLAEAFFLTPEFLTLQRTFARADREISKRELLNFVLTLNWTEFKATVTRLHVPSELAKQAVAQLQKVSVPVTQVEPVAVVEVVSAPPPMPPPIKVHVVKAGDSLWKIAKSYRVDIAKLKTYNHLHSDVLRAGVNLCIP